MFAYTNRCAQATECYLFNDEIHVVNRAILNEISSDYHPLVEIVHLDNRMVAIDLATIRDYFYINCLLLLDVAHSIKLAG